MRTLWMLLLVLFAGCANDAEGDTPSNDRDGDGFSNGMEEQFGSDPDDADSVPRLQTQASATFFDAGLIIGGLEDPTGPGCGAVVPTGTFATSFELPDLPEEVIDAWVTRVQVTATYEPTMPEGDIYVFGPDGTQLTDSTPVSIPPSSTDSVVAEGRFPYGPYDVEVRGCIGAGGVQVEGVVDFTYVTAPTVQ